MGLLDKAKAAAVEATAKAKEGVEDVQLKRELSQAHNELGKIAFELVESGRDLASEARDGRGEDTNAQRARKGDGAGATAADIGHPRSEPAARHADLAPHSHEARRPC